MYSMKTIDRRTAILAYIRSQVAVHGQPPTLAEIATACGFASRGAVRKHMLALEAEGQIDKSPGKARGARPRGVRVREDLREHNRLFEISQDDVAALTDVDLRELVGRLCMAALSNKEHPPLYVTWGGDQRAADGGVDVRMEAPRSIAKAAGFERHVVGYQVKATTMPRAAIQKEMCPQGVLRPAIRNLIRAKGAYIIASSESTSDSMRQERIDAMREAARDEPGVDDALFDFYDSRRLADLANQYPGVVAWVRGRIGKPLQGWKPFGNWVTNADGGACAFINDEKARFVQPTKPEEGLSLKDGVRLVRSLLAQGKTSVRITGLSGVGKTRFAQALFEEAVADGPLDSQLAVYTDFTDSPMPPPQQLMDELQANSRRAIVIVDNCSADLHRQLAAKCKSAEKLSLLTIEYDIRDDVPERTSIFRLEPGSPDLIEKVVLQQVPHISKVDAETITRLSEGNSRVAIALAHTVRRGESIAGLDDDSLFRRLFWQKNEVSESLLHAAQACALVYSFDGDDIASELRRLAELAGMRVNDLFREVDTLLQRGLAQRRGPWRAILPHAVAHTLAIRALSAIAPSVIRTNLVEGPDRLLRSFSRRLGYLHRSGNAVGLVRAWLSPGQMLGDLAVLEDSLVEVLSNVAPIAEDAVLEAFERALRGPDEEKFLTRWSSRKSVLIRLLRAIAYTPIHFERCLAILLPFALDETDDQRTDRATTAVASLFTHCLSGTHATLEQRARWIKQGFDSSDERLQRLAVECLESGLKTRDIMSFYTFDFGAQSRNYGAHLKTRDEQVAWFETFVKLAVEYGRQESSLGERVRNALTRHFQDIWRLRLHDVLEQAAITLSDACAGKFWLTVRQALRYGKQGMNAESMSRLEALEIRLRPYSLVDNTRAIVLQSFSSGVDVTDGDDEDGLRPYQRADQRAEELGRDVVRDSGAFQTLLSELVDNRQGRQFCFGIGLAQAAAHPDQVWNALVTAFDAADHGGRNFQVLNGFLRGLHDRDRSLYETLLDEAMVDPRLVESVPILHTNNKLDTNACDRILRWLARDAASADPCRYLAYGSVTSDLTDHDMAKLVRAIADKDEGLSIALDVMAMYLHGNNQLLPELKSLGREILPRIVLTRRKELDFAVNSLIEFSLTEAEGEAAARTLLRRLRNALEKGEISPYGIKDVFDALLSVQPRAALDEWVGEDPRKTRQRRQLAMSLDEEQSPMGALDIETMSAWCRSGSSQRWVNLALWIPPFAQEAEDAPFRWSGAAIGLLEQAPDRNGVAAALLGRLSPMSWSGSRADAMRERLPLFDALDPYLDAKGSSILKTMRERFEKDHEHEREHESRSQRVRNESFE